jgi:hypothetical protein
MSHESAMDVIMPDGSDYLAMGVAFLVYFFLSFLWWGPLFGKKWGELMGMPMDPDDRPSMAMPMVWQALGTVFLSYVLWHVMQAFAVTHDGEELVKGDLAIVDALIGAGFTWLGFFVPVQLGRVAWEKASWALFGINAGGHLVALLAMSVVFALM